MPLFGPARPERIALVVYLGDPGATLKPKNAFAGWKVSINVHVIVGYLFDTRKL